MKFLKSNQRGFTLIELLVVVAIISLLSSVVLATLKDARDKANASKFKQEINQFTKALELYRSDNGMYPGEGPTTASFIIQINNQQASGAPADLATLLSKYLPNLPKVINSKNIVNHSWGYRVNGTNNPNFTSFHYRCEGDTTTPKYIVYVINSSFNSSTFNAVSDWPKLQESFSLGSWSTPVTGNKCFSFK
jgi:type II secretion system protein G